MCIYKWMKIKRSKLPFITFSKNIKYTCDLAPYIQRILLEQPRLVSDHFYLATSFTSPNQNEAEDIGHLKYML